MKNQILNRILFIMIIGVAFTMVTPFIVKAQFLPLSFYYTTPLYYPNYTYSNTINGSLLGYLPFTPFLDPATTALYTSTGIT